MIGMGLKKIAKSYGMTIEKGYSFGEVLGYLMTFYEGMGYKRIYIAVPIEKQDARREILSGFIANEKAYYKISNHRMSDGFVEIYFYDTVGTKQRIVEFIGAITKKLSELDVPTGEFCGICFKEKDEPIRKAKMNDMVLYVHESCYSEVKETIATKNEMFSSEKKNHLPGALGALLGGLIGTIPWVLVYMLGFFVGWLGFVIGLAANKGYTLFKGRNSKLKPWIIILVVVFCVIAAQFVAECIQVIKYFNEQGYNGYYTFSDVVNTIVTTFKEVPEYKRAVIGNVSLGFLFAGLGIIRLIKGVFMESKDHKLAVIK